MTKRNYQPDVPLVDRFELRLEGMSLLIEVQNESLLDIVESVLDHVDTITRLVLETRAVGDA